MQGREKNEMDFNDEQDTSIEVPVYYKNEKASKLLFFVLAGNQS